MKPVRHLLSATVLIALGIALSAWPAGASVTFLNVVPSAYLVGQSKALLLSDYVQGTGSGDGFNGSFVDLTYGFSDWLEAGPFAGTSGDYDSVSWGIKTRLVNPQRVAGWTISGAVLNLGGGGRPEYYLMGGRQIGQGTDLHLGLIHTFGKGGETNAMVGLTHYIPRLKSYLYLDGRTQEEFGEFTGGIGLYRETEFGWLGSYLVLDSRPASSYYAVEIGFFLD